jgi:hypothetical protein
MRQLVQARLDGCQSHRVRGFLAGGGDGGMRLGGYIVTLHQDPETGAIVGYDTKARHFFNKAYENGRWSKSGPVVQPEKVVMGRG